MPSLNRELAQLENDLTKNPKLEKPLGHDSYKIRIAVKSKGKGESGGLRVIRHIDTEIIGLIEKIGEDIIVNLIAIYDKSETATITNKELIYLIKIIQSE